MKTKINFKGFINKMLSGGNSAGKNQSFRSNIITYAAIVIFFVIMQTLQSTGNLSNLFGGLLVPLCIYSIMAVSLNLTVGILGELSLGHAGFMCVGAFASAFFSIATRESISSGIVRFLIAMLIGIIFAAIAGIIVGIPVLRLRGDYLAIVTLAFGEIIKNIINVIFAGVDNDGIHFAMNEAQNLQLSESGTMIVNGAQGISGTSATFSSTFLIGIICLLITLFVILNLIKSRAGRAIMAIRDNRIAAESVGINVTKYKLIAFTISAAFAGVAGVLYSHNLATLTASSKQFGYNMSIMILVFVVLGGIGNIRGSIIAAALLYVLPELLRGLQEYRMLIYAVVLIFIMIFSSSPKFIDLRKKYNLHDFFKRRSEKLSLKKTTKKNNQKEGK